MYTLKFNWHTFDTERDFFIPDVVFHGLGAALSEARKIMLRQPWHVVCDVRANSNCVIKIWWDVCNGTATLRSNASEVIDELYPPEPKNRWKSEGF